MNKNRFVYGALFMAMVLGTTACKDQLNVGNPNAPTLAGNVTSEASLVSLAQGGVYINGFLNGDAWLGNSYFSLPWGYNELMADVIGADASNNQITTIGSPESIKLDNGTVVTNPSPSIGIIRAYNNRAATGNSNNPIYYQWLNMYALNNACNTVLAIVDNIKFSGDQASRANTVKAWCYFWKAYAYGSIGSMYYSGVIADQAVNGLTTTNSDYVLHDAIIDHSQALYRLTSTTLAAVTSTSDYSTILGEMIPLFCQQGTDWNGNNLGAVPTIAQWNHVVNTLMARNILLNKLAPFVNGSSAATINYSGPGAMTVMQAADWDSVLTLTSSGIGPTDPVFLGRSSTANSFFGATGGTVPALITPNNISSTFKISLRVRQNYSGQDKRFLNNFDSTSSYNNSYTYTTPYNLADGGHGMPGVYVLATRAAGKYPLYICGSYEENALMAAEANIRKGSTSAGLALIDAERAYQGAGIAPSSGATADAAMAVLVRERKVALLFRGISYYDSRRWGWTFDQSMGGGSYGNTVIYQGQMNTNVFINYNFMDYWDVPADETVFNPTSSSVATKNPNFN